MKQKNPIIKIVHLNACLVFIFCFSFPLYFLVLSFIVINTMLKKAIPFLGNQAF